MPRKELNMSLVISHVGEDFAVLGSDRGSWSFAPDGTIRGHQVMPESKIFEVPGVPVVLATVGAWYPEFIARWLGEHPLDPQRYSVRDFAEEFVADYFAHHSPRALQRLADNGLSLPSSGEFERGSRERLLAAAQVVIAGTQPGVHRAQLWTADFPDTAIHPAHYTVTEEGRKELASVHLCGNFEPFDQLLDAMDHAALTKEQSAEMVEFALGTAEKFDRWKPGELSPRVMAPFDVVRVTHGGLEWISRAGISGEYVAGFDSAGNLKQSSTMNTNVPNSIAWRTNAKLWIDWPSGSSTATYWLDDGSGNGVAPTIWRPDGTTVSSVVALGGNGFNALTNGINMSGLSTSSTAKVYFCIYFIPGATGGVSSTGWYVTYQNTPFGINDACIAAAYQDGGYIAFLATINTTNSSFTSGALGGKSGTGGRALL